MLSCLFNHLSLPTTFIRLLLGRQFNCRPSGCPFRRRSLRLCRTGLLAATLLIPLFTPGCGAHHPWANLQPPPAKVIRQVAERYRDVEKILDALLQEQPR